MKVIIYALIDPITCKVKYIGRTSVKLNDRLSRHIHSSKYSKSNNNHKDCWIKSLLKINCRPLIRKLIIVEGWEESYQFEINLINKYKNRLTNYYDRGPGELRSLTEGDKLKISNTLKKGYETGRISKPKGKTIYVYNRDGSFYSEYKSIQDAAKSLGVFFGTIKKHINGKIPSPNISTKDGRKRMLRKGYQYSLIKVDKMHNYNEE